jgi:hypothetical protein
MSAENPKFADVIQQVADEEYDHKCFKQTKPCRYISGTLAEISYVTMREMEADRPSDVIPQIKAAVKKDAAFVTHVCTGFSADGTCPLMEFIRP